MRIVDALAGVQAGGALAEALGARAETMDMTEAAHDAVLSPADAGGISHGERAAMAERIARIYKDEALAEHYASRLSDGDKQVLADIRDPRQSPAEARLGAALRHLDMVTIRPSEATEADVDKLRLAGISEPDIVRLSELVAFVNYQVRVIAGLRLLETTR